jgi:hypothetical protein
MFRVTRLYSDQHGDSHFEDLEIPLDEAGMIGSMSVEVPASGIIFREVDATYDWDFHNTPRRQFLILLDGKIEIETSLGERRTFGAGDVLKLEDVTGKGHRTKNVEQAVRKSVFITLP